MYETYEWAIHFMENLFGQTMTCARKYTISEKKVIFKDS